MPLAKATTPYSLRASAVRPVLRAGATAWAMVLALGLAACVLLAQGLALHHTVEHAVGRSAQLQQPKQALALHAEHGAQPRYGAAGAHDTTSATCLLLDQLLALHPGSTCPSAASPPRVASPAPAKRVAPRVATARHSYLARGPPAA
jgi:hypothetical protein